MRIAPYAVIAGLLVAVATPLFSWHVWGAEATWPGLFANFAATFAAFLVALGWERDRALHEARAEIASEEERRTTEARRRLAIVLEELKRLEPSVNDVLEKGPTAKYFLPDLPLGAWAASREPLAVLIADYKLVGDLGTLYERVADLQWRLRFFAQLWSRNITEANDFRGMVLAIAREVQVDIERLVPNVERQITKPEVQRLGLVHTASATIVGRAVISAKASVSDSDPSAATRE